MGRLIYRMCLIVVLVVAVAGGIYYYTTFYGKDEGPRKGTFVNRMDLGAPDVERVVQTGKQIYEAAESQVKEAAREAFVYLGETVKE